MIIEEKRVLSLFSGCGGMDLGFEGNFDVPADCVNTKINPHFVKNKRNGHITLSSTGFKTVFANDILDCAKTAWTTYFSNKFNYNSNIYLLESIVDLVKKYKEGNFNFPQNIDIVTGGFPCQDFSVAGKRLGFNSTKSHNINAKVDNIAMENRGMLYLWMKEVIEIVQPKVFIAENVKGLLSFENVRKIIENDFRNIGKGYIVLPAKVLYAPDYGIPQKRERVIFIGLNKSYIKEEALVELSKKVISKEYCPFPTKTHKNPNEFNYEDDLKIPYVTVKTMLQGLNEPTEEEQDLSQMSYSKAKFLERGQGQTEVDLNGLAPTIRAEHHGNIEYRRLSTEHNGKNTDELSKGLIERRLTIRECARLQTFPNDYKFVIKKEGTTRAFKLNASNAYKIIGNAVPPLLAYNIAKRLNEIWNKIF